MAKPLTIDDVRQSLNAHAAAKGAEIFAKYGPRIGWNDLPRILADRTCVRYPCEIQFNAEPLLAGEVAYPLANGARPEDGFKICIHPFFQDQLQRVPYLVFYQLVLVLYGEFASSDDAETFGCHALGLTKNEYYQTLCELADQAEQAAPA